MSSYHDLHVTVAGGNRVAFTSMPFGHQVICSRTAGWTLWFVWDGEERLIAGEYHSIGLRLDVDGVDICNSIGRKDPQ